MHIAEDEWMRFYQECEECVLPQPSPASPDNWSLCDLEVSDFSADHEGQQPPAKSDEGKRSTRRQHREVGNHSLSGGANDELSPKADGVIEKWVLCLIYSAISAAEVNTRAEHVTTSPRTEDAHSADDKQKVDGDWQSDNSSTGNPLPYKQGADDLSGNKPRCPDRAASVVALTTEKERWFVTVNDSPAQQRVHVTSVKKKRRLKQSRNSKRLSQSTGCEKPVKTLVEFKENEEKARAKNHVKSSSKRIKNANVLVKPDLSQMPLTSGQHEGAVYIPSCRASSLHDACASTGLPELDRVEAGELVDTPESCDSDSYLSATDSLKEPRQLFTETQKDTEDMSPPSAGRVNKMPDKDAACDKDTRCTQVSVAGLTSGPRLLETDLSPSVGGLSGDQLRPASTTVFTPSLEDNPETRAVAAGHPRPVYAISAFWDNMEKVTINDILQLRMARGAPDKSPHSNLPTNHCSLANNKSATGVLLDTSDSADSDYFTQFEESKPDQSSCGLSTSEFEEEQLVGTSRNSSPDLQHSKRPRARCSPYLADEEGESAASEGMETPVPAGDFAQTCLEVQECVLYSDFLQPQRLMKSKSMRNVRALRAEDSSLHDDDDSRPVLCSPPDENSSEIPFLSNEDTFDNLTQVFSLEAFEGIIGEDKSKTVSRPVLLLYDRDPVFDYSLLTLRDGILFTFLRYSRCIEKETIPIFSYSHPLIRTLTFPSHVFPNPLCKRFVSPPGVLPGCPSNSGTTAVSPHGFDNNQNFTVTKIRLHHKAGIWCRSTEAWMLPLDVVALRGADPQANVVTEGGAASAPRQSQLAEQQIWETINITSKSKMSKIQSKITVMNYLHPDASCRTRRHLLPLQTV